jgi:hypothetical protein
MLFRALLTASMLAVAVPNAHAEDVCVRVSTSGTVAGSHATEWVCVATPEQTYYHETDGGLLPEAAVMIEYYLPWK